jgi:precorrin-3B synthase
MAAPCHTASASTRRCPSVEDVVTRVDGGLARVRLPGGRISSAGLAAVADAAERHGAGLVEITGRANLQLRGLRPGAAPALSAALTAAGVRSDGRADRRRNVLLDPIGDLDPAAEDLAPLVAPLLDALDADRRLDELDDKFGFALSGGGTWHLGGRRATVVVCAPGVGVEPEVRWAWATEGHPGTMATPLVVPRAELVGFLAHLAAASLNRPRASMEVPDPPGAPGRPASGPLGAGDGWVGAMPILGRADAGAMRAVAEVAERYADASVRLTPWRGFVLAPVATAVRAAALAELRAAGLVVDPSDPASSVVACTGRRGCTSALTDAVGDAEAVIAARRRSGLGPLGVVVSGCGRCCAAEPAAALRLVGCGPARYDLRVGSGRTQPRVPAASAVAAASRP